MTRLLAFLRRLSPSLAQPQGHTERLGNIGERSRVRVYRCAICGKRSLSFLKMLSHSWAGCSDRKVG